MIEVKHKPTGKVMSLDGFWLRDHCQCSSCYNFETKQRKYNLLDIPVTVKPLSQSYSVDGLKFEVKWNDGHSSTYDIDFLHASQMETHIETRQKTLLRSEWNVSMALRNEQNLRIDLPELVASDVKVKDFVRALIQFGIAFIDKVPPTTTMTEMAIRCAFPIMKTFFGEMFTFTDAKDHADTAYSKEYLGSHTDNTYFCDAAGLQALHCISHIGGTGGENFFVDGLHAALELKRRHPEAFEILSSVQVPAEYIEEGQYHKHSAPMIRLDPVTGEIIQLRLNVYDRGVFNTIPQKQMQAFYAAFRQFLEIIQSQENQWTFKLQPGTVVVFDNWRVYHARHAYTGLRTMTGCYVQRTDFLSKARVLGIID